MKLIIEDDEGRKTVVPLVREEITIGRQDGNIIRIWGPTTACASTASASAAPPRSRKGT